MKTMIKKMLVKSPVKYSERMDVLLRLNLLKSWINDHQPHPYFKTREELYAHVANEVVGNKPISFLEFGVYKGDSIGYWAELNTHGESEFFGFDSFEGLPEKWVNIGSILDKGYFSTDGIIPETNDERVSFIKGWFNNTLPVFLNNFSSNDQLIIHCDADLYHSTLFVLCSLDYHIKPGVIIIFDDFSSILHDFRALADYSRSFQRKYEVLGASGRYYYEQVAIKITE